MSPWIVEYYARLIANRSGWGLVDLYGYIS